MNMTVYEYVRASETITGANEIVIGVSEREIVYQAARKIPFSSLRINQINIVKYI